MSDDWKWNHHRNASLPSHQKKKKNRKDQGNISVKLFDNQVRHQIRVTFFKIYKNNSLFDLTREISGAILCPGKKKRNMSVPFF